MGRIRTNKNQLRKILLLLFCGYFFFFIILIIFSVSLSNGYSNRKKEYLQTIESKLTTILNESVEDISIKLPSLVEEYPMEIIVYKNDKSLFQTIPNYPIGQTRNLLNEKALIIEEQGLLETTNGTLFVWYAVYNMPDQEYLDTYFSRQTFLIVGLFIVLLAVSVYTQVILIRPVQKLKKSLTKAEQYQFEDIVVADDILNQQFFRFTNKMKTAVITASKEYTQLERVLQIEKDRMHNTLIVIRALIHDLKTPIHHQLLENETRKIIDVNSDFDKIRNYNIEQTEMELKMINDILKVMDEDIYDTNIEKEVFDLTELVFSIKKLFRIDIENKGILLTIDIPEHLMVCTNLITMKLLIHNILSNACQYANNDSEIVIDIFDENEQVVMRFSNVSSLDNINRMKKSENIFWAYEEKTTNEHQYSSGNGLYLIQELTELIDGVYDLEIVNDKILIEIILSLGGETNDA